MSLEPLEDPEHFHFFAVQRVLAALCNPELPKLRGTFRTDAENDKLDELGLTQIQRSLLFDSIAFGKRLPHLYTKVPASALDNIAKQIDFVLDRLEAFFPQVDLTVTFTEIGEQHLGPISGDFHLSPTTRAELRRVRGAAKHFANVIRRRGAAPIDYMGKLAYLWPAYYLEKITGKPHYSLVATLLAAAGFGDKQPEQLSKAAKDIRERSPMAPQWLVLFLPNLPGEEKRDATDRE